MEFQSIIKRTRKQKILALAAGLAITIAKEKQDPNYENYHNFRSKFVALKRLLFSRYRREALYRAKQAVRQSALSKLGQSSIRK